MFIRIFTICQNLPIFGPPSSLRSRVLTYMAHFGGDICKPLHLLGNLKTLGHMQRIMTRADRLKYKATCRKLQNIPRFFIFLFFWYVCNLFKRFLNDFKRF
jgi:hypothetical protein